MGKKGEEEMGQDQNREELIREMQNLVDRLKINLHDNPKPPPKKGK